MRFRHVAGRCRRTVQPQLKGNSLSRTQTFLRHSFAAGRCAPIVAEAIGRFDLRMVTQHYGHIPISFGSDAIQRVAPDLQVAA